MTTSPFVKVAATLALALASVFASVAVPSAAHAARADAVPATKAAKTLNPNLIQIPASTREKLDAFFLKRVQDCRGVMVALDEHINDPWEIEDAWLIVAWHFAISKGRRAAFNASRKRLASGEEYVHDPRLPSRGGRRDRERRVVRRTRGDPLEWPEERAAEILLQAAIPRAWGSR